MKFFHRLLSIATFVLLATLSTFAQQRHPIQVITQFQSPYTLSVPQWYGGPTEKLSVWLTNQDLTATTPTPVYLKLKIKSPGVSITSKPNANYPIIQLHGGVPVRLSLDDLAPYLNPQNWNFESGLTYDSYVRSFTLPEGYYNICFEAIKQGDPPNNNLWSNEGCAQVFLSLNDPPFLNLPRKGESIIHREPANIIFQWTPRHMADVYLVQNTEYEFSMMELVDNGMAPEVAFMQNGVQPFYQERSMTSTFLYGPQQPLLTPGRRYAWRICVKAADGTNLSSFKNAGCSEVYWFTYQNDCKPPINIQAEAMTEAARITWTPVMATANATGLGGNYVVEYREHKLSAVNWTEMHTATNRVTLANLHPDRTYEFRVGRSCDDNLTFVYSDVQRFKTNAEAPRGNCGDDKPYVPITNREPIQTLHVGDIITAGSGRIRLTQVSGQGRFTGYGYSTMSLLKHAQFKVKFADIVVNTDKQLIGGFIESTYDKEEKQIYNLDKKIEGGQTAAVSQSPIPVPQHTIPFEITDPEAIQISESSDNEATTEGSQTASEPAPVKLSIKNPDGSVKELSVASLPATIQDKNNTIYKVEKSKDGKTLVSKVGQQQASRPSTLLASAATKATVHFKNYPEKQRYAFDEYQPAYSKSMLYKPKYEALADNYFVSSKAIVSGQTDVVKAVLTTSDKTIVADSVRFVNNQGLRYPSTIIDANTFEVTITGGTAGQAQELYAVYPTGKSTISLGKLLITSYPTSTRKVVLVPVNNASINKDAISEQLNTIYNTVGVQFEVSQDASFDDMSWDSNADGKLATKGSGLFSMLTPEMKALNQAYAHSRTVQADALYLFVLASADETVAGDMPRGKQFGYLFTGDDGKVAAHEIGHGLFKLKHTFDGYGFAKGELAGNLMDYPAGEQFTKYQWDQIHDPGMVIGVFEKDSDGELPVAQIVKCVSSAAIDVAFNYTFKWLELCWDDKSTVFTDYKNILSQINKAELLSSAAIACGTSVIPWPTDKSKMIASMTAAFGAGGTAMAGDLYSQYESIAARNPKLGASEIIKQLDFGQALSKGGIQAAIAGVATGITIYSLDHPKFKNFAAKLQEKVSKQGTAFLTKSGLSEEAVKDFLKRFKIKCEKPATEPVMVDKLSEPLLAIKNSVSEILGNSYKAVAEVSVSIKNVELLNILNSVSKGDWIKVYEASLHNGSKIEIHYFRNNVTGQVFDVKIKYDYWHQKSFKNLKK